MDHPPQHGDRLEFLAMGGMPVGRRPANSPRAWRAPPRHAYRSFLQQGAKGQVARRVQPEQAEPVAYEAPRTGGSARRPARRRDRPEQRRGAQTDFRPWARDSGRRPQAPLSPRSRIVPRTRGTRRPCVGTSQPAHVEPDGDLRFSSTRSATTVPSFRHDAAKAHTVQERPHPTRSSETSTCRPARNCESCSVVTDTLSKMNVTLPQDLAPGVASTPSPTEGPNGGPPSAAPRLLRATLQRSL